jgi:hypothetical protein
VYSKVCDLARQGLCDGRQVDWGAFAIKVNGPQLLAVLNEARGDPGNVDPDGVIGKYVAYARDLGSENFVALVSAEL